jgi:hypothetical protein
MKQVEQHIPPGGSTTIYVQGHLLNHNIGGPGLDYNMVPLTGKPAKNVGGNDANAEHLNLIEKAAKNTWDMVKAGKYQEAVYEVIPDYSRTTRPGTTQIRGEAEKLKEIRQAWIKNRMELIGKLPESDLAQFYVHTLRSFGITPTPVLPTKEQVIQELANKLSSDDLTKTFGVLKGQKHPVAEVIDKHIDSGILKASALGNLDTYSINDLLYLLDENANVWEAEDVYVPAQLKVSLQWTDNQNKVQQHHRFRPKGRHQRHPAQVRVIQGMFQHRRRRMVAIARIQRRHAIGDAGLFKPKQHPARPSRKARP